MVWVSAIEVDESGPEPLFASGVALVVDPWDIELGALRSVAFEHTLPSGS
jgi:hypothetical protein